MTDVEGVYAGEEVGSFGERARSWLPHLVARFGAADADVAGGEGGEGAHRRAGLGKDIQRAVYDAGFAGITFPPAYGGLGLSVDHRDTFLEEVRAYGPAAVRLFDLAGSLWGLSIGMIAPTMLELATEEQKRTYIPEMLRGEKLWVQMLSEPTGGSDLAGAITRARRDGDRFVVNGSKVWTSQADFSDMGVLLARTNWDVPKHQGLTMLIVSLDAPGLTIQPIRLVSGGTGFCQEYFDDMIVPASDVLGSVDDGWHVASRLLVHERNTVGGGSSFHTMSVGGGARGSGAGAPYPDAMSSLVQAKGLAGDSEARHQAAEVHVLSTVSKQLAVRVMQGMDAGTMPPAAGSLLRLFGSLVGVRTSDVGMAIAGPSAVAWPEDRSVPGSALGVGYLGRQGGSMASGTAEIQRNIISERVLGLPREPSPDRGLPFNQVLHNALPGTDRSSG